MNPLYRHLAASQGHVRCMAYLLAAAPSTASAANNRGETACHLAALSGCANALNLLLLRAEYSATSATNRAWTPLHYAAAEGRTTAVKRLLQAVPGAATARAAHNTTPLYLAAQNGHEGAVAALLEAAPGTACSPSDARLMGGGWTPAHIAAARGHAGVLKLILKADPKAAKAVDLLVSWRLLDGIMCKQPNWPACSHFLPATCAWHGPFIACPCLTDTRVCTPTHGCRAELRWTWRNCMGKAMLPKCCAHTPSPPSGPS